MGLNKLIPLTFKECEGIIYVENKMGELLGIIYCYKVWKTWVWEQEPKILVDAKCLEQVLNYLKKKEKRGVD